MQRTTIYLTDTIKRFLLEISAEESKKQGKRIGMTETIRKALVEYLERRGMVVKEPESIMERMLSTKGMMGEDFEKRVKEAQKEFGRWKIRSV